MPKITGAKAAAARINALRGSALEKQLGSALFEGGDIIAAEAAHLITQGSVGGKNHVPSKPGEPPNENYGTLRKNIEVVQVEPLLVEVSSNAPYAAALEYGTVRMAPRPYMAPAVARKRNDVVAKVRANIDILTKRGGGVRGLGD